MIDIHIHTTYSDGTEKLTNVLNKAQQQHLSCISITDHNTVDAYYELENPSVRNLYDGKILVGCEINTFYNMAPIELLCYGFDYKAIGIWLQKYFSKESISKNRINAFEGLKDKFIDMGLHIDRDLKLPDTATPTEFVIDSLKQDARNLQFFENEVWEKIGYFYRRYVANRESSFFVDDSKLKPTVNEIIDQVHLAGGKVFLAHLYAYCLQDHQAFVQSIVDEHNLDGIECYHWTHKEEQVNYLLNFCKVNNLLISGGSDYHGSTKPWLSIGTGNGTLNVPDEVIYKGHFFKFV